MEAWKHLSSRKFGQLAAAESHRQPGKRDDASGLAEQPPQRYSQGDRATEGVGAGVAEGRGVAVGAGVGTGVGTGVDTGAPSAAAISRSWRSVRLTR